MLFYWQLNKFSYAGNYVLDKFHRNLGSEGCENIRAAARDKVRGSKDSKKSSAMPNKENNTAQTQILHCYQRLIPPIGFLQTSGVSDVYSLLSQDRSGTG